MQYISPDYLAVLAQKLKVGNQALNIKVEVDKMAYSPHLSTEMDYVRFITDDTTPVIPSHAKNKTSASRMICPIKDKLFGDVIVTSEYAVKEVTGSDRYLDGVWSPHHGIDIGEPEGVGVVAVADGIVVFSGDAGTAGNMVAILHANGIMTRYMHGSVLLVEAGRAVTQGEDIMQVGHTGRCVPPTIDGAHLHFEVRINATKDDIGDSRPPRDYLEGSKLIETVSTSDLGGLTGTITGNDVRFRSGASIDSSIIATLAKGTTVTVISQVGEWYNVNFGGQMGFVYGAYVSIAGTGGGGTRNDEIINAAKKWSDTYGGDWRFLIAICRQETSMGTTGAGRDSEGSYILGYGVYDDGSGTHTQYAGIDTQMKYGAMRVHDALASRGYQVQSRDDVSYFHYGGDLGRSYTWSSSGDTWVDGVWKCYQEILSNPSAWDTQIGGEHQYGTIKGIGVNVRDIASYTGNIITTVNTGLQVEYFGSEGEWFKIGLSDGRAGYIYGKYLEISETALLSDYSVETVYSEDFEKFTMYSAPTGFSQNVEKNWKIYNEGVSNILGIKGGTVGQQDYIKFNVTITNAGMLEVYYKNNLSDQNVFNIVDNETCVFSVTSVDSDYQKFTMPLLQGTHEIKFARIRNVDGNDEISIDNLAVKQYLSKPKDTQLFETEIDMFKIKEVKITADAVNLYNAPSDTNTVVLTATRGDSFKYIATVGTWYKVGSDSSPMYIQSNLCDAIVGDKGTLLAKTGGFIYDRTLTLNNVKSVDIDYKYEMRSAEAVVVISNEDGFYSPDYNPSNFPEANLKKSPFVEYYDGKPMGVLSENTPIRISIGYGDRVFRRFTGLIDVVDMDSEAKTISIRCSDMMKKLNNYLAYQELTYPPDQNENTAWLVSSVIHDLAIKAGMNTWRVVADDLNYPDIVVEETYYTDLKPNNDYFIVMDELGNPVKTKLDLIPEDGGYRNPYIWTNKVISKGTCFADWIDEQCQNIHFWQRCDLFGTYHVSSVEYAPTPSYKFIDNENLVSVQKTIDYSRTKNHIMVTGNSSTEHFFDKDLWLAAKGERRSCEITVSWADSYGKKETIAKKMFLDMKMSAKTLQAVVEGNPFIELLDTVQVINKDTTTYDNYVVKGVRDSFSVDQGYLTMLDLFWTGGLI